jgi:cellulose biosynthesis protein BcsQ
MPAHLDLDTLHGKLESLYKIYKWRDALNELDMYDAIYIDTPPALNFYTRSALFAAKRCLIPFDCDDFSRGALYTLLENVNEIQQDYNVALEVESSRSPGSVTRPRNCAYATATNTPWSCRRAALDRSTSVLTLA